MDRREMIGKVAGTLAVGTVAASVGAEEHVETAPLGAELSGRCSKCGHAKGWIGPFYQRDLGGFEFLRYDCLVCHYGHKQPVLNKD